MGYGGYEMREIWLSGKYSNRPMLVDDDIYEAMVQLGSWNGQINDRHVIYGRRNIKGNSCLAHRYAAFLYGILESWNNKIDVLEIDHINHDSLDNRRCNLRAVTKQINQRNRLKCQKYKGIRCSSRFKGVIWDKHNRKWYAQMTTNRYKRNLGCFKEESDAAKAYDVAARQLGYLESSLNFPQEATFMPEVGFMAGFICDKTK